MGAAQAYPAFASSSLDKTSVDNPRLVNQLNSPVGNKIGVNQNVQIMSDVQNNQNIKQSFVYIVQIKDSDQKIISLGWFSGTLDANQIFSPSLSWTPEFVGEYTAEIFVWDDFTTQLPLAKLSVIIITAS